MTKRTDFCVLAKNLLCGYDQRETRGKCLPLIGSILPAVLNQAHHLAAKSFPVGFAEAEVNTKPKIVPPIFLAGSGYGTSFEAGEKRRCIWFHGSQALLFKDPPLWPAHKAALSGMFLCNKGRTFPPKQPDTQQNPLARVPWLCAGKTDSILKSKPPGRNVSSGRRLRKKPCWRQIEATWICSSFCVILQIAL